MNIFYLSKNQEECARWHCDKHVVKMILETAQMLCTAHWENGGEAPYKSTHKNHPSTKWARSNQTNYKWLAKLGKELCKEYTHRYGKIHKTEQHIDWLIENIPNIPKGAFTEPTIAMAEEYRRSDLNTIDNYKYYYQQAKSGFLNYKYRNTPEWLDYEF